MSSADAFERKDENTILISFAKAYDVSGVDTVLREISFEKETGSFTVRDHVVCDECVPVLENLDDFFCSLHSIFENITDNRMLFR